MTWFGEHRAQAPGLRDRLPVRCVILGLVVPVVAVLLAAGSVRQAVSSSEEVLSRQRELQNLKAEIEANRKEIARLREREEDLTDLTRRIRRDRELTLRYLAELEGQETTLREGIGDRQLELLEMEDAAAAAADRLKKGIRRYYRIRELAGPELILSSRSFGELFARGQFLARWIHHERIELMALADRRQRIVEAASVLEQQRRGIATLQQEKRSEEARLRRQGAEAQARLEALQGERSRREKQLKEQEKSQEAIRRMIERLEKERTRSRSAGETPAFQGSLAAGRGRLPWPVDGKVIGRFGVEVSPRYGTKVPSNGIDIAAPAGTPIRAVAPGRVEFVDWLPGYGRTVILNHGSGYYTLYAHASTVEVVRGETVVGGQVIARVGDTDSVKGTCLHFEVRQAERALDPMDWLR